jgi:Holin of 3TMs, for gene-transfer release
MDLGDLVPGKALLDLGMGLINKLIPDPAAKAKAQMDLLQMQQSGALEEEKTQLSAIIAEANSTDKWTSRARPSFLYVVYILLLAGIPMGVVFAISPTTAGAVTTGFRGWLSAIPSEIIELFKWVMLGYIGGRSFEKVKGAAK